MSRIHPDDVVLVTGASTGLGLAIARRLLETEHRIVLTARESSIPRFAAEGIQDGERTMIRPLDVTDDDQRRAVVDEAQARWGGVHVLINNAGVAYRAVVEHVRREERLSQMDVNFRSPMQLARLVLPGMRAYRRGRVINVSSVGGMMAMPTMGVYSASKFALEGATEALWYEVRPWGIRVTLVEPGFIHSDAFTKVVFTELGEGALEREADPYHAHYKHMEPFIGRFMTISSATPDRVARRILKTLRQKRPPLRVQATLDARAFSLLRRVLPQRLYHEVLYRALPGVKQWGPGQNKS